LAAGITSDAETVLLGVDFNDIMGLPNPFVPPQQGRADSTARASQVERCGLQFTACHFSQHYQRNNRGGGLKNIKCFPSCRTEGHRESSFCGNAVNLVLSLNEMTDPSQSGLTYHCFGQFRCAADLPMCEIGEVLDLVAIERQCASVQDGRREGGLAGHVSKGLFSSVSTPQPNRERLLAHHLQAVQVVQLALRVDGAQVKDGHGPPLPGVRLRRGTGRRGHLHQRG